MPGPRGAAAPGGGTRRPPRPPPPSRRRGAGPGRASPPLYRSIRALRLTPRQRPIRCGAGPRLAPPPGGSPQGRAGAAAAAAAAGARAESAPPPPPKMNIMDFNVKKLAADAGTFLSRAVQVRPRSPAPAGASPGPSFAAAARAAGGGRGRGLAPRGRRWPRRGALAGELGSALGRGSGGREGPGRAGGWARRGLPALRERQARLRWREVSPDLWPGRAAMCCCEAPPSQASSFPRGSPASPGLGKTRGFRTGTAGLGGLAGAAEDQDRQRGEEAPGLGGTGWAGSSCGEARSDFIRGKDKGVSCLK